MDIFKGIVFHPGVHEQRLIFSIGDGGGHHKAHFVDDTGTLEGTVQDTAALKEQFVDAEIGFQLGQGFWQMSVILWIMGIFDRFFIDWYWVERTKAWIIPGTEDLMPYIPVKTKIVKWTATLLFHPLIAAAVAGVVALF